MKLENKDFWEKETVISTQDQENSIAADFEIFMFEQAKERQKDTRLIEKIKIFGCGTGREINETAKYFAPKNITASDISKNMITKCNFNLKLWNIDAITQTIVGNAKDIKIEKNAFDLVVIFNSMLTYVAKKTDRQAIFNKSYEVLKSEGVLIGTVHNQEGTLAKTYYFKLRNLFSFILGEKAGNRYTGFKGYKVPGYYYDKKGLTKDILDAGFKNIDVYSLEEFYTLKGQTYNRKTGYNNLIFIASK